MNKKLIIFGIGPLAKTVFSLLQDIDTFEVGYFMVDDDFYDETTPCLYGKQILKKSMLLTDSNLIEEYNFLSCVGYKNMRNRKKVFDDLSQMGCQFINLIHPSAVVVGTPTIGTNNIVFPSCVIENDVKIGNNNLFWTQAIVGHNIKIGNHNFFAAHVTLAGNCNIGDLSFLGVASFTINNLMIRDETFLVAGSGLFTNTKKYAKYWGNPAKKIESHEATGIMI